MAVVAVALLAIKSIRNRINVQINQSNIISQIIQTHFYLIYSFLFKLFSIKLIITIANVINIIYMNKLVSSFNISKSLSR